LGFISGIFHFLKYGERDIGLSGIGCKKFIILVKTRKLGAKQKEGGKMARLKDLLESPGIKLAEITEHLRKSTHYQRIEETIELGKLHQSRLWDLAKEGEALSLDYLVPAEVKPLDPQPFEGKNSLPIWTRFQKVFYRTSNGEIAGYNNSPAHWLIGWGYYITEQSWKDKKELAVNYMKLPNEKPVNWPEIKSNTRGFSILVYGNMVDFLRWVSEDVVIGRATRKGEKIMNNWFVLCRKFPRK